MAVTGPCGVGEGGVDWRSLQSGPVSCENTQREETGVTDVLGRWVG